MRLSFRFCYQYFPLYIVTPKSVTLSVPHSSGTACRHRIHYRSQIIKPLTLKFSPASFYVLGAFRKNFEKWLLSSPCLSVRSHAHLRPRTGNICMDSDIPVYSEKFTKKTQVSLKSNKSTVYFRENQYTFIIISLRILLRTKIFQTNCRKNRHLFYVQ